MKVTNFQCVPLKLFVRKSRQFHPQIIGKIKGIYAQGQDIGGQILYLHLIRVVHRGTSFEECHETVKVINTKDYYILTFLSGLS